LGRWRRNQLALMTGWAIVCEKKDWFQKIKKVENELFRTQWFCEKDVIIYYPVLTCLSNASWRNGNCLLCFVVRNNTAWRSHCVKFDVMVFDFDFDFDNFWYWQVSPQWYYCLCKKTVGTTCFWYLLL
jgi:hypothetical protein